MILHMCPHWRGVLIWEVSFMRGCPLHCTGSKLRNCVFKAVQESQLHIHVHITVGRKCEVFLRSLIKHKLFKARLNMQDGWPDALFQHKIFWAEWQYWNISYTYKTLPTIIYRHCKYGCFSTYVWMYIHVRIVNTHWLVHLQFLPHP